MKKILSIVMSAVLMVTSLVGSSITVNAGDDIYQNNNLSRVSVHDPSIVKANGKYYVFGSHIAGASSSDLINWTGMDSVIDDECNNLLSINGESWKVNCAKALEWTTTCQKAEGRSDSELEYSCWAPDVIYNEKMGKWCMYACSSVWGRTYSVIFLAVSDNIEGPYEFQDTMIYSGFTSRTTQLEWITHIDQTAYNYEKTNIPEKLSADEISKSYTNKGGGLTCFDANGFYDCGWGKFPNCIDPTAFVDKSGNMWLVYGSFSGGIFVVPLDEETGFVDYDYMSNRFGFDSYFGKQILRTNGETEGTGEGPYIVYDKASGYYYLYVTYGGLAGDGGYNIREYRSKSPSGPYLDKAGNSAHDQKNTGVKLMGNYKFSCQKSAMLSGGHSSSFVDDDGRMYQVYHTRFLADNGWGHQIRVHQMARTSDGWAVMLPFEYQGESVTDGSFTRDDIVGEYEFINHTNITHRLDSENTTDLNTIVIPTQKITLCADGSIVGAKEYTSTITCANTGERDVQGSWSVAESGYFASFLLDGVKYEGVFAIQKDESSEGKECIVFSAIGENNAEIWGAKPAPVKETPKPAQTEPPTQSQQTITKPAAIATTQPAAQPQTTAKPAVTQAKPSGAAKVNNEWIAKEQKNTKIKKLTGNKKSFNVSWSKVAGAAGYQVQYATDSKFKKNKKTVTISKNKTTSSTVKKLKGNKKYYVRMRSYKNVKLNGKTVKVYSGWTKAKTVKTKK